MTVNQSLPFLRFSNADWEMLVDVRNLFREADSQGSLYDEAFAVASACGDHWTRLMVEVNGVTKMHDTRVRNMLVQPQVIGYKKHPILLAEWMYFDMDGSRRQP